MFAFLQTVLWVGLIVWCLLRFEKSISAVVAAITKRIQDGDELAAPGGFRIGMRQTPAEEQKHKLQEEAKELVQTLSTESEANANDPHKCQQGDAERPSVKDALEAAVRDVSDAQTLGLNWLGMVTGGQVVPNLTIGGVAFDGLLRGFDGKSQSPVLIKLINSVTQVMDVVKQVENWTTVEAASAQYVPLPITVLMVTTERVDAETRLWDHVPPSARAAATWYQVDLNQLRATYGFIP